MARLIEAAKKQTGWWKTNTTDFSQEYREHQAVIDRLLKDLHLRGLSMTPEEYHQELIKFQDRHLMSAREISERMDQIRYSPDRGKELFHDIVELRLSRAFDPKYGDQWGDPISRLPLKADLKLKSEIEKGNLRHDRLNNIRPHINVAFGTTVLGIIAWVIYNLPR